MLLPRFHQPKDWEKAQLVICWTSSVFHLQEVSLAGAAASLLAMLSTLKQDQVPVTFME